MEEHLRKRDLLLLVVRNLCPGIAVLMLVSIGTVYCGIYTMNQIMNYQLQRDWIQHTVLTDYNDMAGEVKL